LPHWKKDRSHDSRIAEMRTLGLDVIDTSWSRGKLLDCIVRHRGTGRAMYVEIKNSIKGKLTPDETAFVNARPEACRVVASQADALALWAELRG
jgi:hypothetical protein